MAVRWRGGRRELEGKGVGEGRMEWWRRETEEEEEKGKEEEEEGGKRRLSDGWCPGNSFLHASLSASGSSVGGNFPPGP